MLRRFVSGLCAAMLMLPATGGAQAAPSPLPKTGVDYSAIDLFYRTAGILSSDADPTEEQWSALFATPGYRLVLQQNRGFRQLLLVAFKPSRKATRDSVLASDSDAMLLLRHLTRAYALRDAMMPTRAGLEKTLADSIAHSVRAAAKFLPPNTVETRTVPFIAFAVFANDGYALDGGILLDLLNVHENGVSELLAHELHHVYTSSIDRTIRPGTGAPPYDVWLASPIMHLRTEGIADLIDKTYPLPVVSGALSWYAPRYNDVYAKTPQILRTIDSLLVVVRDDSTKAQAAGQRARSLLWSNSHPNGAYMARAILTTFGVDSLLPGVSNPFAFVRAYAAAEVKRGNPPPFSPKAVEMLGLMEQRYIKP
jgi:hypothetical protein